MWRNLKPYLFVLPAVSAIIFLFFSGFVFGFLESIGVYTLFGDTEISFHVYRELLTSPDFIRSILYTLRVTSISTVLSAFLGLGLGICFVRMKGIRKRIAQFPMLIPHLAVAYLVVLLFMQSGWVARLLFALGLISDVQSFPVLVHDPFGWGIIIAYLWKESPFIAIMISPVLQRIDVQWSEAAQMLGAGKKEYFRDIVLPLLAPSWLAASAIVFVFTFSAFEIPLLLGVTYPEMIAVHAYHLFSGDIVNERPLALALNILVGLLTAGLGIITYRIARGWVGKERRGWN